MYFQNKGTNAPQLGSVKHPDFILNNRFLKTVSISGSLYYVHPLSSCPMLVPSYMFVLVSQTITLEHCPLVDRHVYHMLCLATGIMYLLNLFFILFPWMTKMHLIQIIKRVGVR